VHKGDQLTVLPQEKTIRVRGLRTHNTDVEQMGIGNRAAMNLQGIEKNEINRGDMLTSTSSAFPVREFTGIVRTVSKIPIKIQNRSHVHVYVGTTEQFGQLIWFEKKSRLEEQETYHVRVKLDSSIGAAAEDVFLIRSHSPVYTLGGGKIIEINPPRISHQTDEWIAYFKNAASFDMQIKIAEIVLRAKKRIVSLRYLSQKLFEDQHRINEIVDLLIKTGTLRGIEIKGLKHVIHSDIFKSMAESILLNLTLLHEKNPLRNGSNKQELINSLAWRWLPDELVDTILKFLINQNKIRQEKNIYALTDFKIRMSQDRDTTITKILKILAESRFEPPALIELAPKLKISENETESLVRILIKEKKLISITNQIFIHHLVWDELLQFLRTYFTSQSDMPVSALKEFIQTTRKYAIPLFEFLDSEGYTRRVGDIRQKGMSL